MPSPCATCGYQAPLCDACRRRSRFYLKRGRLARREGRPLSVPAERSAEHIKRLRAGGMIWSEMQQEACVQQCTLRRIEVGVTRRVYRTTEQAILAVQPAASPTFRGIPAGPTWGLIYELAALGWPQHEVGLRAGLRQSGDSGISLGRLTVTAGVAARVRAVYNDLSHLDGPSDRTRAWAARLGYLPPRPDVEDVDGVTAFLDWRTRLADLNDDYRQRRGGGKGGEVANTALCDFLLTVWAHPERRDEVAQILGASVDTVERRVVRHRKRAA